MSVGHRLERGESLRRNDEKCLRWIQVLNGFRKIRVIDVGNKTKRQSALAVMLERLVSHHRPKVRTTDADVDDVANAFGGVAQPSAASDAIREVRHFIQHGVDFRHDVHSVNNDRCSLGSPQSNVKHGAILCDIDLVPAEHGFNPVSKSRFFTQLDQELQRLVRNPILRIIQEKPGGLRRQALATPGVIREKLSEVQLFDFDVVRLQSFPCCTLSERYNVLAARDWCGARWHTRVPLAYLPLFRLNSITSRRPAKLDIFPRSKNQMAPGTSDNGNQAIAASRHRELDRAERVRAVR